MKLFLAHKGTPLPGTYPNLAEAYIALFREFKLRWPRAIWGTQEAAGRGLTVEGRCELTPEEAKEMREELHRYDDRPNARDFVLPAQPVAPKDVEIELPRIIRP